MLAVFKKEKIMYKESALRFCASFSREKRNCLLSKHISLRGQQIKASLPFEGINKAAGSK